MPCQLHEVRETEDGYRAHVLLVGVPPAFTSIPMYAKAIGVAKGWITAVHKDGRRRLMRRHQQLGVEERRVQTELWHRRTAADRALTAKSSSSVLAKKLEKLGDAHKPGAFGFAHELADCPRGIAFAYGGLHPGTLHAHGALVKTHQVSYSIGAAGRYLLHVGLRQKEAILPGSPFVLEVKPGPAHAPSTDLPAETLPLETIVGTRGTLLVHLSDSMGNRCIEGGEPLKVSLDTKHVEASFEDSGDGAYLISWHGE